MTENDSYTVILTEEAEEDLGRIDKVNAKRIRNKLEQLALNAENQSHLALKGKYRGLFRIRSGNYRAIYELFHSEKLIVVVRIRHRREAYDE